MSIGNLAQACLQHEQQLARCRDATRAEAVAAASASPGSAILAVTRASPRSARLVGQGRAEVMATCIAIGRVG
jgi:hypothetical protein